MTNRREFITVLGGAAAWPFAARAQQRERMRRIGVLMNLSDNDPDGQDVLVAFLNELQRLGWSDGRNARIETRWGAGDRERYRRLATGPRYNGNRKRHRSFSSPSSIQSAPGSSKGWRGRAAMPRVSPCSNTRSQQSGWNCSKRLHRP